MIDNKLTKEIQELLAKEALSTSDILHGADILLRINRNHALYQLMLRNPKRYEKKLVYELNKHLAYRLDGLTLQEVRDMDNKVITEVDALIAEGEPETEEGKETADDNDTTTPKRGRRADHASLPVEIQALWDKNADRYKKIKEARATVETLEMACDRYEYLKFMKEAYAAYKTDMQKYDDYKADAEEKKPTIKVSSARAYISKNCPKYETLSTSPDTAEQASALKEKIQQRVDAILNAGEALSDGLAAWLTQHDFDVPTNEA